MSMQKCGYNIRGIIRIIRKSQFRQLGREESTDQLGGNAQRQIPVDFMFVLLANSFTSNNSVLPLDFLILFHVDV